MSPESFRSWLEAMEITAAAAARLLGVQPNTITKYKRVGGSAMLGLACRALYHRLEPW